MKKTIKQYIILFLLTTFAWFLTTLIGTTDGSKSMAMAWGIIIAPVFGGFNLLFMLIIHYSGLNKLIMSNLFLLIFEVVAFYLIYAGISQLIDLIPHEYKFEKTPTSLGVKSYLSFPFDFVYTFIVLTIIIYIHRIINKQLPKTLNKTH